MYQNYPLALMVSFMQWGPVSTYQMMFYTKQQIVVMLRHFWWSFMEHWRNSYYWFSLLYFGSVCISVNLSLFPSFFRFIFLCLSFVVIFSCFCLSIFSLLPFSFPLLFLSFMLPFPRYYAYLHILDVMISIILIIFIIIIIYCCQFADLIVCGCWTCRTCPGKRFVDNLLTLHILHVIISIILNIIIIYCCQFADLTVCGCWTCRTCRGRR